MKKIKWTRSEDGHVESKDGRFMIEALYYGTTRAQGYYLYDYGPDGQTLSAPRYDADTQAQAKATAQRIVDGKRP